MLVLVAFLLPETTDNPILNEPTDRDSIPVAPLAFTPHDPIYIQGNAGFTNESGVIWGDGSESDPYIIADWDINASSNRGIYIQNTNVHFMIRACYIHDGVENENTGIYLDNCSNGIIRDSNCSGNWYGIFLLNSSCANTIVNNTCSNNRMDGIELYSLCNNNTISNNTFSDNLDGAHFESSRDNIFRDNVMTNNGVTMISYALEDCTTNDINISNTVNGRPVYFYRDQSGITVPANAGEIILANCTNVVVQNQNIGYAHVGIEVAFSTNITIDNNTFSNNSYGILLWFANNSTLSNNTIHNNDVSPDDWWYGIGLHYSSNNTICNNTFSDSIYGLGLRSSSDNNMITNNHCFNNSYGLCLWESNYNKIAQNQISSNTYYGMSAFASIENVIWNNTFIGNNGATDSYDASHVQANETFTPNWWNSTDGYGNWWSDWTGPDADMDGIVDLPYSISGDLGTKDYYPLTTPQEPIPEFSMMPLVAMVFLAAIFLIGGARRRMAR